MRAGSRRARPRHFIALLERLGEPEIIDNTIDVCRDLCRGVCNLLLPKVLLGRQACERLAGLAISCDQNAGKT